MYIAHSHVLLDACCILNFCASGNLLAILQAMPAQVAVTLVVQEHELRTLQRLKEEENEGAAQFEAAIAQGLIIIVDFESEEEEESFLNYAAIIDDRQSAICAIAFHRGWAIATDDKNAVSFFKREAPHLQILSTPEIIKHWSEAAGLDSSALRDALIAIWDKGRYSPKNHPLQSWWEAASTDVEQQNA